MERRFNMGLDSSLYKETHLWNFDNDKISVKVSKNDIPINIQEDRVVGIVEEVKYWRKQNAIHNYFVQECGDRVDKCQRIRVSVKQLVELMNRCKEILADKDNIVVTQETYTDIEGKEHTEDVRYLKDTTLAEELLPTTSGFFFGSTDYDEWYIQGLETTIECIEKEIRTPKNEGVYIEYFYQASW